MALKIKTAETFPLEVNFCWPSKQNPQLEGSVTAHVRLLDEKERETELEAARKTGDTLAEFRVLVPRIEGIPDDDGKPLDVKTVWDTPNTIKSSKAAATDEAVEVDDDDAASKSHEPSERASNNETEKELIVWPENMSAVLVYLRCQSTTVAGFSGAFILGVSAVEALAAARMLRIPVREWPEVLDGVQLLASHVAKIENDKAKARAEAKR